MNNGDRKFSWRHAAELIAVASVVFSLIFVGLELRLSRAAAEIERTTTISALNANIRSQISMNSETWYRGCIGEDLSPEDRIVFTNTVLAYINLIFTIWSTADEGLEERSLEGPARRLALNRYRYAGFEKAWQDYLNAFRNPFTGEVAVPSFYSLVDQMYDQLQNANISKDFGPEFCGR